MSRSLAARSLLVPLLLACAARAEATTAVTSGAARFEFLTPSLIRMQYAPSGKFADAPTAVVHKRDWPAVAVRRSERDGAMILATSALSVLYKPGSGAFTPVNLEVQWKDARGGAHSWHPGDRDARNLGGLTYSLDNISKANLPEGQLDLESPINDSIPGIDLVLEPATPGLLSRSGYAFIDDSRTPLLNARHWVTARPDEHGQDWYVFVYDHNFRQVLQQYAELCGSIPMIPRFVLGPWITDLNFEYFPGSPEAHRRDFVHYDQQRLMDEVARLSREQIPVDVLVLDFAWHNYGWDGGYDWSPLIPHPDEFMQWLHRRGIKLSLNDHPGYIHTNESILSFNDSHAPEVLAAVGRVPPARASFSRDIENGWTFGTDPDNRGLADHWYTRDHPGWKPIRIGLSWEEQGYKSYRGVGWYHAVVDLPAQLPGHVYLNFGQVDASYRLFVNGREAEHAPIHWPQRLTSTEVTPLLKAGVRNDIYLRVEPGEHGSGIRLGPAALTDVMPAARIYFDLSNQKQADVFMRLLHGALMKKGVDLWWVDGGSGAVDMPGLNKQLWTNKVFYDYSEAESGQRAFILGRYGDWGSERYPGFFTGDTYSEWPVLAYEVAFSARGGNVLVPYISHDIGGFHGAKIDFDLYARWIEFGTFSAILRMHSAHANPREGNVRMPWVYGARGIELMKKYFTLRMQLIPYIYSYSARAHQESLPLMSPLYLEYPELEEAYQYTHEYFFGQDMLVAPVLDPSGNQLVYLPPGSWRNFFSGKSYAGAASSTQHYATDEIPVFVRAGALVPLQPPELYSDAHPLDRLIVNVFGAGNGSFDFYEDDGRSLDYRQGKLAHTALEHSTRADGVQSLIIAATQGEYRGQPAARSYELRLHADARPHSIALDGTPVAGWTWDPARSVAVVNVPAHPIRAPLRVEWRE